MNDVSKENQIVLYTDFSESEKSAVFNKTVSVVSFLPFDIVYAWQGEFTSGEYFRVVIHLGTIMVSVGERYYSIYTNSIKVGMLNSIFSIPHITFQTIMESLNWKFEKNDCEVLCFD